MKPDPRISSYLKSNELLPEELRPAVNDCIAQLQDRISSLDQQLVDHEAQLRSLQKAIEDLSASRRCLEERKLQAQEQKMRYKQTLSPLRRTPPEVIAYILGFALETTDGLLGHAERAEFRQYRHVSRLWRAAALSSPCLWRGLRIGQEGVYWLLPLAGQAHEIERCFMRILTSWFSRAGEGAHVELAISPTRGLSVSRILEVIRESPFHVASLSLEDRSTATHFQTFTDLFVLSEGPHSYPTITSLTVFLPFPVNRAEEQVTTLNITRTFPNLETFAMSGVMGVHVPVVFAHQNLKYLQLDHCSYPPLLFSQLLECLPKLETLELVQCKAGADDREVEIPPYQHQNLSVIRFTHSAPLGLFIPLTCPSLDLVSIDGEFRSRKNYVDAGRGLIDLIDQSLASEVFVVASASRQGPMIHQLLRVPSAIKGLGISSFSDLDPSTFSEENLHDVDTSTPLHPFLIPSTLDFVRCSEEGTEEMFWSWVRQIQRYLRPGQELDVEAPGCFTGEVCFLLKHHIPTRDYAGKAISTRNYVYQHKAIFRSEKFTFYFYARKSDVGFRSRRVEKARLAVKTCRMRMSMKREPRRSRRLQRQRSAIFATA